jgi:DNA-binding NtrC family response regulator
MSDPSAFTQNLHTRERMPVRALSAEVIEGPDAGKATRGDIDQVRIGVAEGNELLLTDPTVSRFHVVVTRTDDGILVEDKRSTNGTLIGAIEVERGFITPGTVLTLGESKIRIGDSAQVEVELFGGDELAGLRAGAPSMRRLFAQMRRAAQAEVPVLLRGEAGTGKEGVARALHDLGSRAKKPFIIVDCASLSPTLVASELFGHEKGAFTGADRRHEGAFERANGGTIFLDEIGELPESLQPTLLGALERKRFRRLGGREEISVDVKVVCATHRDLYADVNSGRFRLDLFYRLAVVALEIPPLRDRADDVPLLIEHFCRQAGYRQPIESLFPPPTLATLRRHDWPGNVRELRNVVEATLAMGETPALRPGPGRESVRPFGSIPAPAGTASGQHIVLTAVMDLPYKDARNRVLSEFEVAFLRNLLERAEDNVSQAARLADMDRSHLWELVKRHNLR